MYKKRKDSYTECGSYLLISPLHRLQVVKERTETTAALKYHGAEAPEVDSDRVRLVLKQLRSLDVKKALHLNIAHLINANI